MVISTSIKMECEIEPCKMCVWPKNGRFADDFRTGGLFIPAFQATISNQKKQPTFPDPRFPKYDLPVSTNIDVEKPLIGFPNLCLFTAKIHGSQMASGMMLSTSLYEIYVHQLICITLWLFSIAMENEPFFLMYLLKRWFAMAVLNNHRVTVN